MIGDAVVPAKPGETIVTLSGIKPGMSVADVGAGEGYYTVRLAPLVGRKGRVLAEDIVPASRDALSDPRTKLIVTGYADGSPADRLGAIFQRAVDFRVELAI